MVNEVKAELEFNTKLAEIIEDGIKSNISTSHMLGILAAAQFKLCRKVEKRMS